MALLLNVKLIFLGAPEDNFGGFPIDYLYYLLNL